jgi:hypothetical protein
MAAPRRSRRRPGAPEPDPFSPVQWPDLKAQEALQARQDPAELAAAVHRAQVLVEQGYGALVPWLLSDPTPAERSRMKAPGAQVGGEQQVLDVFDQAG